MIGRPARTRADRSSRRVTDVLGAIILGLSFGSVYALLSVGLVLTYRTTGIFNLAFGPQAFLVGRGLLRHARHAPLADVRWRCCSRSVIVVAAGRLLLDRVLVPLPAHRERDGQARLGARPVRRAPADRVPVVRPEHRSRTRSASCPNGSHHVQPVPQRVRQPRRPRDHRDHGVVGVRRRSRCCCATPRSVCACARSSRARA